MQFESLVEVPKGSRNKYEYDHRTGRIHLDRELFTATRYPADYGFVLDTLAEDGDPVDVLILLNEPTFPGCYINCRALGVFRMRDEKGPDAKILAVPAQDSRITHKELTDLPEHLLLEISHFFQVYKQLEPDKSVEIMGWADRLAAEGEIEAGRRRFAARPR